MELLCRSFSSLAPVLELCVISRGSAHIVNFTLLSSQADISPKQSANLEQEEFKLKEMDAQEANNTGIIFSEREPQAPVQFQEPDGVKFARIVLEICIGIFGIGGNLLVCIAIRASKRLQTVGNIFVLSLAVADLGVLLVCLPLVILNVDFHYSWPFGEIGCKIMLPLTDIFYGVSIGSIVGISFHRYRMIVHCMSRQLTATKAKFMVALIWVRFLESYAARG